MQLLKESNEFSFAVISWMCEMLREKTATIQNLASSSPEHRIGKVLLLLAEKSNNTENKELKISLRRQDIAEMAGAENGNDYSCDSQICCEKFGKNPARENYSRRSGSFARIYKELKKFKKK
ncbi:MAG: hypothetical protein ABR566_06235 [Pyrinomonadaceae bacterium]